MLSIFSFFFCPSFDTDLYFTCTFSSSLKLLVAYLLLCKQTFPFLFHFFFSGSFPIYRFFLYFSSFHFILKLFLDLDSSPVCSSNFHFSTIFILFLFYFREWLFFFYVPSFLAAFPPQPKLPPFSLLFLFIVNFILRGFSLCIFETFFLSSTFLNISFQSAII